MDDKTVKSTETRMQYKWNSTNAHFPTSTAILSCPISCMYFQSISRVDTDATINTISIENFIGKKFFHRVTTIKWLVSKCS